MIQINPLKSYIDGGVRAALTTPPSASLVFDLPGKAIWVKGVKLKGTDHTYTFSHDNYITLTNTPDSNESEDIKIGVNTSALKSAIDTTYGVVSTTANGLAPKFTSGNKQAASAATTYYFLGWTGSTLKWYQAPFRNIRINSDTTDCLGVNNTDPLIISSGNGISVTWDSTNKKIIITNTKPDVNHNTDTKVAQSVTTQDKNYAVILKGNDSDEGSITTVNFSTYLKFNPSTKQLTINGNKVITTIDTFAGATTSADGSVGLVTKPLIANRLQFLRGDGTWATPTDTWRPVKVEGTEKLGSNALDLSAGNGISIIYNSDTKKIIITNTKPDVNHNTHYTTMLYIGENNDTKANKNVANPYLKLFDDNTRRATFQIKAGSGIAVASDTNGNITITNSSPDVNHNTDITVKQTPKTDNVNRPLMMINGDTSTGEQINTSMFSTGIYANASTKTITANGFIKVGSSNNYVLLGDGSHKALSDFATSGHTHSYITIPVCSSLNGNSDVFSVEYAGGSNSVATKPSGVDAFGVMRLRTAAGWYGQILMSANTAQGIYYRNANGLTSSVGWVKLLDSGNFGDYAAAKSHTHAISQITNLQATLDGKAAASHAHSYLPLSGGTISGRLLVNYNVGSSTPAIAINFYDNYTIVDNSIAQIKMGTPKYDAYLGLSPAAKGYYGKVGYFMHIGTEYEFLWATSNWTKRMALECSSGNLWVAGSVTASSFVGNATSATKLTSSAGSATLPIYFSDGKPVACTASSVFSNLSNSGNNISVTVAGQNRTLTVAYAGNADKVDGYHADSFIKKHTEYNFSSNGTAPYNYVWLCRIGNTHGYSGLALTLDVNSRWYKHFQINMLINTGQNPYSSSSISINKSDGAPDVYYVRTANGSDVGYDYFDIYVTCSAWNAGGYKIMQTSVNGGLSFTNKCTLVDSIPSGAVAVGLMYSSVNYATSAGNANYASSAGNADTLDGNHASAFATASHTHSYLPLSGGTMTGTILAKTIQGVDNSNRLIYRHLDGQNCNGNYDLYLQYHQNSSIIYLNGGTYKIYNKGANYNGNAATATALSSVIANDKLPERLREVTTSYGGRDANTIPSNGFYYCTSNINGLNDANVLQLAYANSSWRHQLMFKFSGTTGTGKGYDGKDLWTRLYNDSSKTWTEWYRILTSGNFNAYSPKLDGTGASGTWGISITGNAATASKLGTSTIGATNIPIYLNSGTPTAVNLNSTANNLINNLSVGDSAPTDNDYYISQYVGGGTTTITYHRRPHSALYAYIKGKAEGTWNISINGNSATATTATYLNVQYCRDDGQPSNKGLWNTIKNGTTNAITNRVRFYTIYGTTTALGAPIDGFGELLEICSYNTNHWQPQLWFGSGKDGRLYYRNKNYNNNSWGAWRTVAWTSDIPTVTNYYWANVKVSSTSSTSTSPTFSTCYTSNWFRSTGQTGWYNETYSGGWYMNDTTWIRTWNSKGIYTSSGTIYNAGHAWFATNSGYNVGIGTTSPSYKLHVIGDIYTTTGFKKNGSSNSYVLLGGGGHKLISDFATSGHTHAYLPLAGGTMTGQIQRAGQRSLWINGRDNAMIRVNSKNGYSVLSSIKTTNGSWEIGHYDDPGYYNSLLFGYYTDDAYSSGDNNGRTKITFTSDGQVTATQFNGALNGNAATASAVKDLTNSRTTYLNYGAAGITSPSWLCAWNVRSDNTYEIRAISPANVLSVIKALPLAGGTMTAGARISHENGNLYLGRADNNGWVMCQDMCSQTASGDTYWSLRTNGTFHALTTCIGGNLWLNKQNASSSTGGASQLVFGLNGNQHVVISSNTGAVIINPSTSSSTGQIVLRVGTSTTSDFAGNINAAHFYENSDIRYKRVLRDLSINSNIIANLPLFDFEWIENNTIGTGTSAQAVQQILPNIISGTDKLTLDYGVLGTIAGITACKELVTQKSELQQLKEKVKQLEDKLRKYENI